MEKHDHVIYKLLCKTLWGFFHWAPPLVPVDLWMQDEHCYASVLQTSPLAEMKKSYSMGK